MLMFTHETSWFKKPCVAGARVLWTSRGERSKGRGGAYSLRLSFPFSTFYEGAQNVKKPASATQAMFKEEQQQKFYL